MAHFSLIFFAFALPLGAGAEYAEEKIGCTAIAVDGEASVDGSAFAGMNADSANADTRLAYIPAATYPEGTMRDVFTFDLAYPRFVGFGRGDLYQPKEGQTLRVRVGQIPEATSTFGYYESVEPLINEKGLGLGESSCAGMLVNKFAGDETDKRDVPIGLLDTVTLMQLALERCSTARCGVEVMGAMSEKYGFVPTPGEPVMNGRVSGRRAFDDAAEAYTLADATGEAWVFHVLGGVKGITNSVWAAQRVPKGHLALVANDFTIAELPEEPNDDYLFNKDTRRAAIAAKLWDGKGAFHFTRSMVPDPNTFESPEGAAPIPLYASVRRWGLMNLVAPSLKLPFKVNNQDYPFSVKIEKKVTHREVQDFLAYHYQDTEFDLRLGILAGPFNTPFRLEGGPGTGQIPRGISILRTLYGFIAETGPTVQRGWFALDAPLTSVYVPLYAGTTAVSAPYASGWNGEYSRDCAWWAFNFVNNYMQLNYIHSSVEDVYPAKKKWQDTIDEQAKAIDVKSPEALNKWQVSVQEQVVASWWKLADFIVMKYNDGRINSPAMGTAIGYPQWYADMVGFNQDVHPTWVQPASRPLASAKVPGHTSQQFPLPRQWSGAKQAWYDPSGAESMVPTGPTQEQTWIPTGLSATAVQLSPMTTQVFVAPFTLIVAVVLGVVIGRKYEQNKQKSGDAYMQLAA